jgi:hypothetical protein
MESLFFITNGICGLDNQGNWILVSISGIPGVKDFFIDPRCPLYNAMNVLHSGAWLATG